MPDNETVILNKIRQALEAMSTHIANLRQAIDDVVRLQEYNEKLERLERHMDGIVHDIEEEREK